MEKYILVGIVLMTIEQAMALAYNFSTRARNEWINKKSLTLAEKQIKKLEQEIETLNDIISIKLSKSLSPAFVITRDGGIKALPENWETLIQKAWTS